MMSIVVCGGKKVQGNIPIQGSKNAVLPIMAAAVLGKGKTRIQNCPDITDVHAMASAIQELGGDISWKDHVLTIDTENLNFSYIEGEKIKEIRASVLLLGSMLARFGRCRLYYPGGCSIGSRPVDLHLKALQQLGVHVKEEEETISCVAEEGMRGECITLRFPSVGATENCILASVLAKGTTCLCNAAKEPEIVELCHFLCKMGADIEGEGTDCIRIHGVKQLKPVTYRLCPDRIVIFTYAMFAAGCGGQLHLEFSPCEMPIEEVAFLHKLGCRIETTEKGVLVQSDSRPNAISYIGTGPYPGFPTDGQSLAMAVLCKSGGISTIEETIFENRFQMIHQLKKMGANIDYVSNRARIIGVTKLHGAHVRADDLRSGAGLLIAAAMAEGETVLTEEKYIYRGYDNIVSHLNEMGIPAFAEDR